MQVLRMFYACLRMFMHVYASLRKFSLNLDLLATLCMFMQVLCNFYAIYRLFLCIMNFEKLEIVDKLHKSCVKLA